MYVLITRYKFYKRLGVRKLVTFSAMLLYL